MSSIGPHIPDNLPTNDAQESDEDDYTPALPPELAAARKAGPPAPPSRVLGPTFPTAPDPDSDDDVGPQPLPAHVRPPSPSAVDDFLAHEARRRQNALAASNPKPVRDAWMLVPPTRASASADPSRRGPRQFARTARAGDVDSSLWTETPAERQQRLADEVAGRKRPAGAPPRDAGADADADAGADGARKRRRDAEIRRGVEQHTVRPCRVGRRAVLTSL